MPAEPVPLSTERLTLRPWGSNEAERLFDIRRRPDVAQWLGDPIPWPDLSVARDKVAEWSETILAPGPFGVWAIDSGDDVGPRGSVSIGQLPSGNEIEIGWYLHPDSVGRGFASEAAAALLEHTLASGVEQIWAIMWPSNDASAGVAAAIGMDDLGVLDDQWYGSAEEPTSRMFIARSAQPTEHTRSGRC